MAAIFTKLFAAVHVDATDVDKDDTRLWALEVETTLIALLETFGPALINGRIVPSVAGGVLTIAIKTAAGADPSAAVPVRLAFRDETASDGNVDEIKLTAALSMTVSAGSTLGTVASKAFRLWLVVFNDGGTLRLGVINCLDPTAAAPIIYPLEEGVLTSATAEGGAGAADSAGTIYASAAVTTKPFRILGYMTWDSGLATPGTYASVPTVCQPMGPGIHRPGATVQRKRTADAAVNTGTNTAELDDTIPQLSTDGDEYMNQAITPTSKANILRIRSRLHVACSVAVGVVAALFQDSTENALTAAIADGLDADETEQMDLLHEMRADTVSATTFKVHAGPESAGTLTFNGAGAARLMGGVLFSDLEIEEIFV